MRQRGPEEETGFVRQFSNSRTKFKKSIFNYCFETRGKFPAGSFEVIVQIRDRGLYWDFKVQVLLKRRAVTRKFKKKEMSLLANAYL